MLSILLLTVILIGSFIFYTRSKKAGWALISVTAFIGLIIEIIIYGYFLLQIVQGTCFYLIGNQKVLDLLIKARLTYATYFAQGKPNFMNQLDQELGYTIGKNKAAQQYRSNKQGFRADREYSLIPSNGVLRMAVFGDSFVFCDGEKNEDAWPHLLENSVGNLEVLNFGVPGFGLGQAFTRYLKDGLRYAPDIVFFNYVKMTPRDDINPRDFLGRNNIRMSHFYRARFWLENDVLLSEAVTPFHLFDANFRNREVYQALGFNVEKGILANPFFRMTNLGVQIKAALLDLKLKHTPVEDYPIDEELNLAILSKLINTVRHQGATLVFFYYDFNELPMRIKELIQKNRDVVYYIDFPKAFAQKKTQLQIEENLFNSSNHYNRLGNEIYAQTVLDVLKSRAWNSGSRAFQFDSAENAFHLQ